MRRLLLRARRHPWRVVSVFALACAVVVFALVYFAPQDLLINTSVDEPLPTAHVNCVPPPEASAPRATTARAEIVRHGRLSSGEHATSGSALLLRLADG